jgi:hypothetical protein
MNVWSYTTHPSLPCQAKISRSPLRRPLVDYPISLSGPVTMDEIAVHPS